MTLVQVWLSLAPSSDVLAREANAEAASGASRSIVSRHHLDLLCFDTDIVLR